MAATSKPHEYGTYHAPATTAIVPKPIRFGPASRAAADTIIRALGITGEVDEIVDAPPTTYFRLSAADGRRLFVKRIRPPHLESQRAGDAIAKWLEERGVHTNAMVAQAPAGDGTGDVFFVSRFIDWRPLDATESDMAIAGKCIAALHDLLHGHPDSVSWQSGTDARLARLSQVRTEIADGRLVPRIDPAAVRSICRAGADFNSTEARQPLHGDLHLSNILMPVDGDAKPIFIDFEEVGHSVLPARFELALFIERAVLVRKPDDARAAALADTFLSSYFGGDNDAARTFKRRAVETLQALAARSLCVLADMERSGPEVDDVEWVKFVELYAQASRRAQVFGA